MAARSPNSSIGETRFGTTDGSVQAIVYVRSKKKSKGAVLALDAVDANGARTTVYLWASTDGKIRTGTALPTNTEAGTVLGTQA